MTPRPPLPPGPYLVVGLARSGMAAARMLAPHGEVIGVDAARPAVGAPFEFHLEADGLELLDRVACVVKSPGVPREAPVIAAALERGIEVTGELELAWRLLPNRFVAVTGTNGKTTTVELLGAIWREAGLPVAVAGNVGTPLGSLVGTVDPDTTVICECSSFQLEDASEFRPDCAVLLNIEEDHVDRHGDTASYARAKLKIFSRQQRGDVAVLPIHLEYLLAKTEARADYFDADWQEEPGGYRFRGDLIPAGDVRLRGAHNRENMAAAAMAADEMEVPREAILQALRTFGGVPHRLEEVAEKDGVLYINDSKATNVAAAAGGIEAFDGNVHAILGGSLKGGGFDGLREVLEARAKAAYLIGEAAERLASDLEGTVSLIRSETLEQAVADAAAAAAPGDVVLLSPACASYDAFRDYEERGERFRELVSQELS